MAVRLGLCSCGFMFNDLRRPLGLASVAGTMQHGLASALSNRGEGLLGLNQIRI
jgi:hypothetical protein